MRNGLLSAALAPHQVGGLSFHRIPTPEQARKMSGLFAGEPAEVAPRAEMIDIFTKEGLDFIDLMGVYRFRVSGESVTIEKDSAQISKRAASLVDEAWDNLGSDRTPNPLPLRRAVADILEVSNESDVGGLIEDGNSKTPMAITRFKCVIEFDIAKAADCLTRIFKIWCGLYVSRYGICSS